MWVGNVDVDVRWGVRRVWEMDMDVLWGVRGIWDMDVEFWRVRPGMETDLTLSRRIWLTRIVYLMHERWVWRVYVFL
jgi:hypothetical protein